MIAITIDEQACVGCALCVDACPTHVFEFDEAKAVPTLGQIAECFGCLACSQECPADAISHEGVSLAKDFYHEPEALALAARVSGRAGSAPPPLDEAALKRGLEDLGVRLLSLGAVLKETLSNGLPAVGSLAGKALATQLPRYQVPASTEAALELARQQFAPAWEIQPGLNGDSLTVKLQGCFIRDLCARHHLELGGELCVLFGAYLAGYLSKATNLRLRLVQTQRDWKGCSYELKVYA